MKAIISELWDTNLPIIISDSTEDNNIQSFSELKQCSNVLVGSRIKGTPATEIILDDTIYYVTFRTVSHPMGGKIRICEF